MADASYDAVIIGGGNKGLLLAMYLMKYGGMSVGIFERRHEVGGCLATEESAAPGFRGNVRVSAAPGPSVPAMVGPITADTRSAARRKAAASRSPLLR